MILLDPSDDSGENEVLFLIIEARVLDLWLHNILLTSSYDSGENGVLFVKIRARVPKLWFDTSFGPKLP